MLGVQEERCHMSSWGERHVHMCLFALCSDFASCSDFLFPIFSQYPMLDSGGARHLRERNHLNSLHIFTLGDMSNPMWYSVLTLYMSSQSWYSCGFFCLLWLVDVSVLSNLVYSGSFLPKPTQDHKVSICIIVMCMRISCWCTYCLQEGLMSMKVHFPYSHHLLWCI